MDERSSTAREADLRSVEEGLPAGTENTSNNEVNLPTAEEIPSEGSENISRNETNPPSEGSESIPRNEANPPSTEESPPVGCESTCNIEANLPTAELESTRSENTSQSETSTIETAAVRRLFELRYVVCGDIFRRATDPGDIRK
ncbi:MAG: hypothetical protein Q9213_000307 [Squamulea squamosa]